jgi:hypothetical protein
MLSKEFADVNSAACTPQEQLNNFIAASLKGVSMSDITPTRYATVLGKIKSDMNEVLYGDGAGQNNVQVKRQLTEQLIRIEAGDIQKVIDSACFSVQKRALEDICSHGSLSSARLFGVKASRPVNEQEYDYAL